MSQIKYNEKQEAFELPYKLWDKDVTVLFYVEEEQEIMDNIAVIADALAKVDRNLEKIAEVILRDAKGCGKLRPDPKEFSKALSITDTFVELDEGEVYIRFVVADSSGYLKDRLELEYGESIGVEVIGWYGEELGL
ncbi:hypothetical protein SAMN02910447_00570 [Ruminococcus sp. YE71]|uniref:hypothetical protein n=1 Tax=unclassified Ruminococcus TaxID=2608920 RepID=UPI00088B298C|nr:MULTISPECIES: hypothetical protein [unclassified Ruminococcus]SDA12286.1 hypothetical protein SAMN02910446_00569 [Ruminococcus sp. YE78]SFW16689.1 hypothetical protein SAMN02910447_00570 [Ruminococcus sp. YE71]